MPGMLDQISQAIGALQSTTERLTELFDRHCEEDNRRDDQNARRHEENVERFDELARQNAELKAGLKQLTDAVSAMQPVVAGYAISRMKAAGAMSLAIAVLSIIGLLLEKMLGAAAGWLLDRLIH
jgi:hypothetical protein